MDGSPLGFLFGDVGALCAPPLSPLPLPAAAATWRVVTPPDNPAPDGDAVE